VVGIGHDGSEAIQHFETLKPDILLMDIRMTKMSGLDAAKTILAPHPDAKILLLTTFSDDEYIIQALKYGVKGYLIKQDYSSIVPALNAVSKSQTVFGTEIIAKIPGLLHTEQPDPQASFNYEDYGLTDKDYQLISLVADGLSNKEISIQMFLSEGTIRNYLSTILDKLNLRDRTQLAIFYLTAKNAS
ncbi:MAG: response regulator transcription factor, partial [Lactococcus chungangensis]